MLKGKTNKFEEIALVFGLFHYCLHEERSVSVGDDEAEDKENSEEGRQFVRAQNAHCWFIEETEEDSDEKRRSTVEKYPGNGV